MSIFNIAHLGLEHTTKDGVFQLCGPGCQHWFESAELSCSPFFGTNWCRARVTPRSVMRTG